MARIYHNSGITGKNYSRLTIQKLNNGLRCNVVQETLSSYSVDLNQDQIRDLIVQLQSLKVTEPLIEGNL